jgi:hypothetical protein
VAASWTIGSEEDGSALYLAAACLSHLDQCARAAARRAPGRPPKAEPGALRPGPALTCGFTSQVDEICALILQPDFVFLVSRVLAGDVVASCVTMGGP